MIKFTKPTNLNGAELRNELNAAGITITDSPYVDDNNDLFLEIANKDAKQAEAIVASHNGTIIAPELTVEQKLASVGLNLDDLKVALGL